MLRNYFKTAWRNLLKNKFYSFINISGLAIGLAVGLIILLWVQDELSYDSYHKKGANVYKLENMVGTGSSRQLWTNTAAPIGVLAKKEIPGVEDAVRISSNAYYDLFKYGEKIFNEQNNFFVDTSLFNILDFPIVAGNANHPFSDDNAIVITEKTARRYFGNENPIGKVITADDKISFHVDAVVKDIPHNSTFQPEILFPISLLEKLLYADNKEGLNLENDFHQFNYNTFLLLKPGMDLKSLPEKLKKIHLRVKPDDTDADYLLMAADKMHLYHSDGSEGGMSTIRMFIIIAVLILVVACINYVNLSTARSMLRAKEVSLRKIVGAAKTQLFLQFIAETVLLFLFAILLSFGLIYLLVPLFNKISGKELFLDLGSYRMWTLLFITILGTLIISSIYPALLLSSFEPLKAMKGKIGARISDVVFRKILVVVQFAFSLVLIVSTLVIGKQMSYIRSRELGFDKEHVLSCSTIGMRNNMDVVKAELLKQPGVLQVTAASANIVRFGGQTGNNWWPGKEQGETMMISPIAIDKGFIPFFKMQLKTGSGFNGTIADSTHYILNETAVKMIRLKDPIGQKFKLWDREGTIAGVVKDFHFSTMRDKIKPAVFYYQPDNYRRLYIKTTAQDASKAIAALETQWKKYNSGYDFNYAFLDETFNKLYESETRTGWLYNLFAGIAIFISCLGLLGLAAYTAQVRTREIGVRKVLGASVIGIVSLLATDFVRLVVISIVIGIPIAWYVMNKWLDEFAYRTSIGWVVFLVAGIMTLLITLVTISYQSARAALTNPVKSIRTE